MLNINTVLYLLFLITNVTCLVLHSHNPLIKKCCSENQYLKQINSTVYTCAENQEKRLEIASEINDVFLNISFENGDCIDIVNNQFVTVHLENYKVLRTSAINTKYFPKCCPLNYVYNSLTKSCIEKNVTHTTLLVKNWLIKVGLPHCKMITDRVLNKTDSFFEHFINNEKRNTDDVCFDQNVDGDVVMRTCSNSLDVCQGVRCVKKCCPDGQSFINGIFCLDTYVHGVELNFSTVIEEPTDNFTLIYNTRCPRMFLLSEDRYVIKLEKNGLFKYWNNGSNRFIEDAIEKDSTYCIEHAKKGSINGLNFFYCLPVAKEDEKFKYTFVTKIVSCVFLVLTIVAYCLLNEMKNTFGKILVNYCFADLFTMGLLAYTQVYKDAGTFDCKARGYVTIFCVMAMFTWLNVMCIDVWKTFSASRVVARGNTKKHRQYFSYGWGLPLLITVIVLIFDMNEVLPRSIQPHVGTYKCFLDSHNYASIVFLHGPQLIIQIINTVLFVKTIIYFLKVKKEIENINDNTRRGNETKRYKGEKERAILILKLSVVMGVYFLYEVVTAFFVMSEINTFTKYLEVFLDNIICLQGVFIFMIFVCKKKVYHDLKRNFRLSGRSSSPRFSNASTKSQQIN